MALHRRFKHIIFIAFLFTITNFVVPTNNLDILNQTNITEKFLKTTSAIFVSANSIHQIVFQTSKSKDSDLSKYLFTLPLIFFSKPDKILSIDKFLNLTIKLKYFQKSPRAPPVA